MAHRRVIAYATEETLKELSRLLADRGDRAKHPTAGTSSWYQDHVKRVEPAPLGKQRSHNAASRNQKRRFGQDEQDLQDKISHLVLSFPNPVHPVHPVSFHPKMNDFG